MPSQRSAVAALRKLEADRLALDRKQRELEQEAALELGRIVLGTGLENFSNKALGQVAEVLGKMEEEEAVKRVAAPSLASSRTAPQPVR